MAKTKQPKANRQANCTACGAFGPIHNVTVPVRVPCVGQKKEGGPNPLCDEHYRQNTKLHNKAKNDAKKKAGRAATAAAEDDEVLPDAPNNGQDGSGDDDEEDAVPVKPKLRTGDTITPNELENQVTGEVGVVVRKVKEVITTYQRGVEGRSDVRTLDEQTLADCVAEINNAEKSVLHNGPEPATMVGKSKASKSSTADLILACTCPTDDQYPATVRLASSNLSLKPNDTIETGGGGVSTAVEDDEDDGDEDEPYCYNYESDEEITTEVHLLKDEKAECEIDIEKERRAKDVIFQCAKDKHFAAKFDEYGFLLLHRKIESCTEHQTILRNWIRYRVVIYTRSVDEVDALIKQHVHRTLYPNDVSEDEGEMDEFFGDLFNHFTGLPSKPSRKQCEQLVKDYENPEFTAILEEHFNILGRKIIYEGDGEDGIMDRAYIREAQRRILNDDHYKFAVKNQILFAPSWALSADGAFSDIAGVGDVDPNKDRASREAIIAAKSIFLFCSASLIERSEWDMLVNTKWLHKFMEGLEYSLTIVVNAEKALATDIADPSGLDADEVKNDSAKFKAGAQKALTACLKRFISSTYTGPDLQRQMDSLQDLVNRVNILVIFPRFHAAWQMHCVSTDPAVFAHRLTQGVTQGASTELAATGMSALIGSLVQLPLGSKMRGMDNITRAIQTLANSSKLVASIDNTAILAQTRRIPWIFAKDHTRFNDEFADLIRDLYNRLRLKARKLTTEFISAFSLIGDLAANRPSTAVDNCKHRLDAQWEMRREYLESKRVCDRVFAAGVRPTPPMNQVSLFEIFSASFLAPECILVLSERLVAPLIKACQEAFQEIVTRIRVTVELHALLDDWPVDLRNAMDKLLNDLATEMHQTLENRIKQVGKLEESMKTFFENQIWEAILVSLVRPANAAKFRRNNQFINLVETTKYDVLQAIGERLNACLNDPESNPAMLLVVHIYQVLFCKTKEDDAPMSPKMNGEKKKKKQQHDNMPFRMMHDLLRRLRKGDFTAFDKEAVCALQKELESLVVEMKAVKDKAERTLRSPPQDVGCAMADKWMKSHLAHGFHVDQTEPSGLEWKRSDVADALPVGEHALPKVTPPTLFNALFYAERSGRPTPAQAASVVRALQIHVLNNPLKFLATELAMTGLELMDTIQEMKDSVNPPRVMVTALADLLDINLMVHIPSGAQRFSCGAPAARELTLVRNPVINGYAVAYPQAPVQVPALPRVLAGTAAEPMVIDAVAESEERGVKRRRESTSIPAGSSAAAAAVVADDDEIQELTEAPPAKRAKKTPAARQPSKLTLQAVDTQFLATLRRHHRDNNSTTMSQNAIVEAMKEGLDVRGRDELKKMKDLLMGVAKTYCVASVNWPFSDFVLDPKHLRLIVGH